MGGTWKEVAANMTAQKNEGLPVNVMMASVDLKSSPELKKRFKIKSVPHLALFRHKKMYVYAGAHTRDALVDFATGGYGQGVPVPPELTLLDTIKDAIMGLFGSKSDEL